LRSDNLDSIAELYTEDDFRQLVVAIEATPTSFGSLCELEDHGERGLVRETSFGAHGAVAHRGERTSMTFVVRRCFQCSAGKS
jgi:hypothetical protein